MSNTYARIYKKGGPNGMEHKAFIVCKVFLYHKAAVCVYITIIQVPWSENIQTALAKCFNCFKEATDTITLLYALRLPFFSFFLYLFFVSLDIFFYFFAGYSLT